MEDVEQFAETLKDMICVEYEMDILSFGSDVEKFELYLKVNDAAASSI